MGWQLPMGGWVDSIIIRQLKRGNILWGGSTHEIYPSHTTTTMHNNYHICEYYPLTRLQPHDTATAFIFLSTHYTTIKNCQNSHDINNISCHKGKENEEVWEGKTRMRKCEKKGKECEKKGKREWGVSEKRVRCSGGCTVIDVFEWVLHRIEIREFGYTHPQTNTHTHPQTHTYTHHTHFCTCHHLR